MLRPHPHLALALLAVLSPLASAACSSEAPAVIVEYEPYDGQPYPNKRTPLDVPAGGVAFVSNSYADTLSVLDVATGEALGTYPVGRDPVDLDGPHHVAVSSAGDAVYVALSYPVTNVSGPHASHGSSTRAGYVQKLDGRDMRVIGEVPVDDNPGDIVLSRDDKRLVVSHFDLQRALKNPGDIDAARATLAVIDPSTLALSGSPSPALIPTCVAPHGVALERPDGAKAYVACYGEDAVAIVDLVAQKVLDRVPVASGASGFGDPQYGPYSAVMSPGGATIAISNTVSRDVRFLDTATGKMLPDLTLPMLGAPYFVAWSADEKSIAVPLQSPDGLAVVDVQTKTELLHRDFKGDECALPHVVARMDDGALAVVCEGDHKVPGKVLWLDPATLETIRSSTVGVYPDSIVPTSKEAP